MSQINSNSEPENQKGIDIVGFRGEARNKNPFKFLDAYTKNDREIFFGRREELDEIYRKFYKSKILLVYGKSGTGKSSIINCGLVSKIPPEDLLIIPVRCSKDPVNNLKADLRKFSDSDSQDTIDILKDIYEKNFKPISLIFDQFEEIFILSTLEERKKLISELFKIIQSKIRVNLVLIFREEYFAGFSEFEDDIPNLYSNRVRIEKLNKNVVEEIIEKPCKTCNVKVEPGLSKRVADLLSKETGEIELTWFQILMDKLFKLAIERDQINPSLKNSDLDKIGDIGNILGDFLNEQLLSMENAPEVEAVLKTMISEDGTKKQITLDEIVHSLDKANRNIPGESVKNILKNLVDRRIISEKDEHGNYEIKHDSLAIRIYERLTAEERKLKEIELLIKNAHKQYQQVGTLLNEQTLRYVEPYIDNLSLLPEQEKFLKHSKAQIQKSRKRKRNIVLTGGIALIVVLSFFTGWAFLERNKAIHQTEIANQYIKICGDANEEEKKHFKQKMEMIETIMMARDSAIRAREIVENELYQNIQKSLAISSLNMNVLYRGVDNPVSISASGIDQNKITPYCYDPEDMSRKATITKEGDKFIIRDFNHKTNNLVIAATGITSKGDTMDLGSQVFRIKSLPDPYVTIGENKLTGGNINKEELLKLNKLDLNFNTDFKLAMEISEFDMLLTLGGGEVYVSKFKSSYITEDQKKLIISHAEPGDLLIIQNIKVNSIYGERKLKALYFRIDGDEIDKVKEKERIVNKLLELAYSYNDSANFSYSYFISKQAYEFDTTSKKAKDSFIQTYYFMEHGIKNFPFFNLYDFKILNSNHTLVIKEPEYLNVEKSKIKLKNGIYQWQYNNPNDFDDSIFLTNQRIWDAVYLKKKKQFVLLVGNPNKMIVINSSGQIIMEFDQSDNTFNSRIYYSNDEKYIIVASEDWYTNKAVDSRANLFNLETGSKLILWGEKKSIEFVNYWVKSPKICTIDKLIFAPFSIRERLELWDFDGNYINGIDLLGRPENCAITPDQKILITHPFIQGEKVITILAVFNLNLDSVKFDFIPKKYESIDFTSDGQYIFVFAEEKTKIYNYLGNLCYETDFIVDLDWGKNFFIEDDVLYQEGERIYSILPLTNTYSNIIKLVEQYKIFGELPEPNKDLQIKIDQIINSK
jgi:hypothetical protein